ncbi:MAG: dTMP kinase [Candidatus Micrarchaeia archaeon]
MLIALEGIDGSSKTTQTRLLHKYLDKEGIDNVATSEPTDGAIGKLIKSIVGKDKPFDVTTLQLLFTADRAYHVRYFIKEWDSAGKFVLCDRYLFSTVAYGSAAGLSKQWLLKINEQFPMPDLTIVLDVSPRLAMERIHSRMKSYIDNTKLIGQGADKAKVSMYEKLGFLSKVRLEYKNMASEYHNYFIVDSSASQNAVHKKIVSIMESNI